MDRRKVSSAVLVILITAGLLVVIELVSLGINRARDEWHPFLFSTPTLKRFPFTEYTYLDPLLGHAHDVEALRREGLEAIPGFAILGDPDSREAMRIVLLGGSTTDAAICLGNWPPHLHRLIQARGIESVIYNGGVGSFDTDKELLKLIRDVLSLEPDLVISYSGANEVDPGANFPMAHNYQVKIMERLAYGATPPVLPNAVALANRFLRHGSIRGVNFGPEIDLPRPERWERNLRLMHAITKALGIDFLAVLQPVLGVGAYRPTAREEAIVETNDFCRRYPPFYEAAIPIARKLSFAADFTDLFAEESDLYLDDCHLKDQGNRLVAEAMLREMEGRGFTRPASSDPGR